MKIYPRSYNYEAEQKFSVYDRDNLADVEVILHDNCVYLRVIPHCKKTVNKINV
jgi:hypothetical protein